MKKYNPFTPENIKASQTLPLWYGIEGIRFLYRGAYLEPLLVRRQRTIPATALEDLFWSVFKEERENGSESDFEKWIVSNGSFVRSEFDNLISAGYCQWFNPADCVRLSIV